MLIGADTLAARSASWPGLPGPVLQPRLPAAAPAAAGDGAARRQRAADRRDRQERRVLRSAAAGGAGRLPGHHPRDRHHQGPGAAAGDPDVQQHPRAGRRAQAPLPAPAHRLPRRGAGTARCCAPACPACPRRCWRSWWPSCRLLRVQNIRKPPSMAESVDWARTLVLLHADALDEALVRDTLNVLLKRDGDLEAVRQQLPALVREATTPR
jgi:hypothetical protein